MVLEGDCTAGTFALAHREVLVESGSSLDRRCVGAGGLVDVVDTAVGSDLFVMSALNMRDASVVISHSAQVSTSAAGVVGAVGLDNIILNKRSSSPTVESDQTVTTSIDGSGIVDGAARNESSI